MSSEASFHSCTDIFQSQRTSLDGAYKFNSTVLVSYKIHCNISPWFLVKKKTEVANLWQLLWQVLIGMALLLSVDIERIGNIYA